MKTIITTDSNHPQKHSETTVGQTSERKKPKKKDVKWMDAGVRNCFHRISNPPYVVVGKYFVLNIFIPLTTIVR